MFLYSIPHRWNGSPLLVSDWWNQSCSPLDIWVVSLYLQLFLQLFGKVESRIYRLVYRMGRLGVLFFPSMVSRLFGHVIRRTNCSLRHQGIRILLYTF